MRHQQYGLTYTPGISSQANHINTPSTLSTLEHHPCHPRWHVTLARCPHNPCYHAINVNTPPTLARLPHKHAIHGTHDSQNSTSFIKLLAILGLKLQEQFLLLLFVFTAFTFQALLSIFIKV